MNFDQDTQTCARMGDALLTACERYAEGGIAPHLIVETAVAVAVGLARSRTSAASVANWLRDIADGLENEVSH